MKWLPTKSTLEKIELWLKISAFLIAAIWAVYVFIYQNFTIPSLEPTKSNVKTELIKIGEKDSLCYYSIKFSVKNEGNILEKFPASYFNITGYKGNYDNAYHPPVSNGNFEEDFIYTRFNKKEDSSVEYIACGRILEDNYKLTPLREANATYYFSFPKDAYHGIQVEVRTVQAKESAPLCVQWKIDSFSKRIHATVCKITTSFWGSQKDTANLKNDDTKFLRSNSVHYFNEYYDYFVGEINKEKN